MMMDLFVASSRRRRRRRRHHVTCETHIFITRIFMRCCRFSATSARSCAIVCSMCVHGSEAFYFIFFRRSEDCFTSLREHRKNDIIDVEMSVRVRRVCIKRNYGDFEIYKLFHSSRGT